MADIGDRVAVASKKGASRSGVVIDVSGAMITVQWGSGEVTSLIPGPGVLSVVTRGSAKNGETKKQMTKKAGSAKKSAAKGSSSGRKAAKKSR